MRRAFTLIEMVVACGIIAGALGMLMSGMASAQRRSDGFATCNIIKAVHLVSQRAACEEGGTTVVHGFTLSYAATAGSPVPGKRSASSIRPWQITGTQATAVVRDQDDVDLAGDIGRHELWSGDSLGFIDHLRPAGRVEIAGSVQTIPSSATRYLHVAYEPRSGFVHAVLSTAADPSPAELACDVISQASAAPTGLVIPLASRHDGHEALVVTISATGVADVRAP